MKKRFLSFVVCAAFLFSNCKALDTVWQSGWSEVSVGPSFSSTTKAGIVQELLAEADKEYSDKGSSDYVRFISAIKAYEKEINMPSVDPLTVEYKRSGLTRSCTYNADFNLLETSLGSSSLEKHVSMSVKVYPSDIAEIDGISADISVEKYKDEALELFFYTVDWLKKLGYKKVIVTIDMDELLDYDDVDGFVGGLLINDEEISGDDFPFAPFYSDIADGTDILKDENEIQSFPMAKNYKKSHCGTDGRAYGLAIVTCLHRFYRELGAVDKSGLGEFVYTIPNN